jgi:hypothetical protein
MVILAVGFEKSLDEFVRQKLAVELEHIRLLIWRNNSLAGTSSK